MGIRPVIALMSSDGEVQKTPMIQRAAVRATRAETL